MRRLLIGIAALFFLLLANYTVSYGRSNPKVDQVQQQVEPELKKYGQIVDFRKTNGLASEIRGLKLYTLYFRAAVRLKSGFCWRMDLDFSEISERCKDDPWSRAFGVKIKPLPAGTTMVIQGEVIFILKEKGWQFQDWELAREGYCIDKSYKDCYKSLWGSENKD